MLLLQIKSAQSPFHLRQLIWPFDGLFLQTPLLRKQLMEQTGCLCVLLNAVPLAGPHLDLTHDMLQAASTEQS